MKIVQTKQNDIRKQLVANAAELQKILQAQLAADHAAGDFSSGGNDSADEANQAVDVETGIAQTSRIDYQLTLTREALKKLDVGTFGKCEDCDEAISWNRLQANPISKRCISCQTKHEEKQMQKDVTPSL